MDYKQFLSGLTSLSSVLLIFSLGLIIGSIALKPYIGLDPSERDLIVILCGVNVLFCIYYLFEVFKFKSLYILEDDQIVKYGRRIGIISLLHLVHFFIFFSLLFMGFHDLQVMMISLVLIIQALLIGLLLKQAYDLVLRNEIDRKFENKEIRKFYFDIE